MPETPGKKVGEFKKFNFFEKIFFFENSHFLDSDINFLDKYNQEHDWCYGFCSIMNQLRNIRSLRYILSEIEKLVFAFIIADIGLILKQISI